MKIDTINDTNIFYTNIIFDKLQIEKIVIAEDKKDLVEILNDNFQDYKLYHTISLQQLNGILVNVEKNKDKHFAMVYEIINYENETQIKEEIMFVDSLEKLREQFNKEEKNLIILDDSFLAKAYIYMLMMRNGETKPILSSKIEI